MIVRHGVLDEDLDFIGKPFSMQGLAERVRRAIDRRTAAPLRGGNEAGRPEPGSGAGTVHA